MSPAKCFETQSRLIRGLAKKAPGVFLGRCANFVLKETPIPILSSYMQMMIIVQRRQKNIMME